MVSVNNSYSSTTTSSTKRYTGLASGLDTDEIVKGMTASTRNKIAKQLQDRQILSWRTDAYRAISKKLIAFSEKFISFSSSSNLFSEKFFENSTITSNGTNAASVTATGSPDGLKGMSILSVDELAATASFMTSKNASLQQFSTGDIDFSAEGKTINNLAGETINLKYDGHYYNVTIPKEFTGTSPAEITDAFNQALSKIKLADGVTTLDSLVKMNAGSNGTSVELSSVDTSKSLSVIGGSNSSLKALGISAGATASSTTPISGEIKAENVTSKIIFNDIIKNKSMTFDLNGVQKKIQFSDTAAFNNITELQSYIQTEMNKSFGDNKIKVELNTAGNGLKFSTQDTTSVLTFIGADTGLTGSKGIMNLETKSSNRLRLDRPLSEIASTLGLTPNADDPNNKKYMITVNGQDFSFSESKSISEVLDTINNSNAGVNIKYLSTTDRFSVTSTETGAQGKVEISDAAGGGNLIGTLLGVAGVGVDQYTIKPGTDAKMTISYDGGPATVITRSSNSFTLDGANITVNSKFDSTADPTNAITFTAKQNTDEMLKGIQEMVSAYNEIVELVNKEVSTKRNRQYSPLTEEQEDGMTETQVKDWNEKAKTGLLFGDSELRSLSSELRFAFSFAVPDVGSISDFGITTASAYKDNGKIIIDEKKLRAALEEKPDEVKKLFTAPRSTEAGATDNDAGIMNRVKKVFDKYAATTGEKGSLIKLAGIENSITSMESSLYKQISNIDTKVTALKRSLITEEDRYYSQFTSLEKYISQMNAQSSWLTQQLG